MNQPILTSPFLEAQKVKNAAIKEQANKGAQTGMAIFLEQIEVVAKLNDETIPVQDIAKYVENINIPNGHSFGLKELQSITNPATRAGEPRLALSANAAERLNHLIAIYKEPEVLKDALAKPVGDKTLDLTAVAREKWQTEQRAAAGQEPSTVEVVHDLADTLSHR